MPAPIASFNFKANGLSVQFTDGSSGIIASWLWDFGFQADSVEQTSSAQNPSITFPATGSYTVSLTVTNSTGTDTYTFPLIVNTVPGMNISIQQLVEYSLPMGIALDSIGFLQSIRQWQLYLQPAAQVPDAGVFDETQWPPLYNVLISKLIIYDMVTRAATASMESYLTAAESLNQLASVTTSGTVQVQDYARTWDSNYPITVNLMLVNGVPQTASSALANAGAALEYFNSLNAGQFAFSADNTQLLSLGNSNLLTTLNYTSTAGGNNGAFSPSNPRVVPYNAVVSVSGSGGIGAKGAIKSLETGPSKAQWYDSSVYWATILKAASSDGSGGGIISAIQGEICMYAGRLTVKIPLCKMENTLTSNFQIARRRIRRYPGNFPPVSNEASSWLWLYW